MKEDLKRIIEHYGVMPQLKYFQSEVFELNEAILNYEYESQGMYPSIDPDVYYEARDLKQHIAEEIADVLVMLKQFQYYYEIEDKKIEEVMKYKIERQLNRIKGEENENKTNNN